MGTALSIPSILEEAEPVAGRVDTRHWAIDEGRDHLGGLGHLDETRVIVAERIGGDLTVATCFHRSE